ncbi:poly(A) polymerase catalytic subunit VP55 [Mythimna separata entomopoxvirus 'L']|uniref:Poly(A) polymerase catalytic subunit n=1 Tax=Mythimna separata entomopoxvirus 'L' TaxID=1293572 RepID=A0A916P1C6_9POXV|nr:poly(A) polymerase catalytic subunit VP55 [Mythimna separata entomopoxvirus 'L']CCU56262.1 poly(A) polymerase catalytic subunit VP55 [Mythimna separata entomopoxvirus 'L']
MDKYLFNASNDTINQLNKFKNQINDILSFNVDNFTKNLFLMRDIFVRDFETSATNDNIKRRVYEFFNKQNNPNLKTGNIISIIKFQHLTVTYVNKLMQEILTYKINTKEINLINFSSVTSWITNQDNPLLNDILKQYVYNQKLKNITPKSKKKVHNKEDLDTSEKIKKILEELLKIILIIKNNDCVSYGSFTSYNINRKIKYNDIDLYSTDSYRLLIFFMIYIFLSIGYDTCLFSIPYIVGHISLKYKDIFIIDCIFLDNYTINVINKVLINNIYFIDPGLQMLNNFRMLSENFRSYKIYQNMEESLYKYKTLLNYFVNNNNKFNKDRLNIWLNSGITRETFPYKIVDNTILISIKELIDISPFDYIMIVLDSPNKIMDKLSKINGLFSRKYGAFINEIFFETKKIKSNKSNHNYAGNVNIVTQLIDENKLIQLDRNNIDLPYNINSNKKYLIFSNLTTTTYVKYEDNKIVDISVKNLIAFIATTCLYNMLHKRDEFAMELYYLTLHSLTFDEPMKLLDYIKFDRYKMQGDHKEISLCKNLFNSIYKSKDMEYDYMDYNTFIDLTNINGGY